MGRMTETRYRLFAKLYFATGCNPQAAYVQAGFRGKTPGTIRANSSKLLVAASMQPYLAEEFARLQARLDLQQDRVIVETMRLSYSNMHDVCSWGPQGVDIKDSEMLPDDVTATIQEVTSVAKTRHRETDDGPVEETEVRTRIKLHPKIPALKMMHDLFQKGSAYAPIEEAHLRAFLAIVQRYIPDARHEAFTEEVQPFFDALIFGQTEALPAPARPRRA